MPVPSPARFNTADEEMFEVTWFLLHDENLSHRILLRTHTHGRMLSLLRVQKREHQTHHFTLTGFRLSVGF